ncbi:MULTISPECIES: sensor histidine kinase [unclassified Rathayibacter]|uniref:sensor histidine kinase n=1 Tax=unclassified Rathayibacter TaxID=2609250 RepID=UPI0006F23FDD|nr:MULTISPECIES: HAMP domain-containing sensor histidine kinase [unclassified Rathayibacter]KQQ00544.1 hypothetical protein ASF42_14395 [Rathayibacter sp. Leaf294]KQS10743.1 hypothetical protein ASG06_14395 [Rathayibacter sp. Leaf185]
MTRSVRPRGLSVRARLTLSYAGFLVVVGAAFFVVGLLLLRFVPEGALIQVSGGGMAPSRSDLLEVFVRYALLALLALAVVGLGGGWLVAGRMLRPLRRITGTARAVRDGALDLRVRLPGRQDELSDLADTFDEMLDRLRESLEVQERFAANASHELRTPLAVLSTMLEVAARNPDGQDYPRLLERLRLTTERAVGLTESLLRLADAEAVAAEPVDLAGLVRASIAENADEAAHREVELTPRLTPAVLIGDPALLSLLVGNLVQNAVRHSGHGGRASISAHRSDELVQLRIESTGSVLDAETAARLSEPFLRGSGRTAGGGHGLGLALVRRIAEVHGGSLSLVPRSEGGLVVSVRLPAAPH